TNVRQANHIGTEPAPRIERHDCDCMRGFIEAFDQLDKLALRTTYIELSNQKTQMFLRLHHLDSRKIRGLRKDSTTARPGVHIQTGLTMEVATPERMSE